MGFLLSEAEAALAKALTPRPAYAMDVAYEIAAPVLPGDPQAAHSRVECALFAGAKTEGGMLRFSLTDEALFSALPNDTELIAMERAHEGLLDSLFAGGFPPEYDGAKSIALAYARLCIILRKPTLEAKPCRELLWQCAKAFSKRRLAEKQLLRALKPYVKDLTVNPNPALRFCRAALGEILVGGGVLDAPQSTNTGRPEAVPYSNNSNNF